MSNFWGIGPNPESVWYTSTKKRLIKISMKVWKKAKFRMICYILKNWNSNVLIHLKPWQAC